MTDPKVSVTWEDQQDINRFSNLYQKQGELEERLQAQKRVLDDLDDASAELMLADDDEPVRMRVGDCFWAVPKDDAEARLEQLTDEAKEKHAELERELGDGKGQLAELRARLYARLGDSINLDVPHGSSSR